MTAAHAAATQARIASALQRIARQEALVQKLPRRGSDTTEAVVLLDLLGSLLTAFYASLALHQRDR